MARLPTCCRIALLLALVTALSSVAGAADRRIALRPLEAYNAADLEGSLQGLQAAAASRLAAPGLQVTTLKQAESATGDWAVRLTLTRVGSRVSIDGAAEPVTGRAEVLRAYEVAESADTLLTALTSVVTSLRKALVAAPLPVAPPSAPPPPAAPVAAVPPPAPTLPPSAPQPAAAPLGSAPPPQGGAAGTLGQALATYRVSEPLGGQALSLAAADVDGDGTVELLVLTPKELLAFRDNGREPRLAGRFPLRNRLTPSSLSAGDVDHDGLPEIFVAGLRNGAPATDVYVWASGSVTPRGNEVFAFLRAAVHPESGLVLLGMTAGAGKGLFAPKIHHYAWVDGAYLDQGVYPGAPAGLVTDFDWHRLSSGGRPWVVQTTQGDTLKVLDADGKTLFEGSEDIKGSENTLEGGDDALRDTLDADFFRVQGKTLLWQEPSGTAHLLLQKNHALTTLFRRARSYSQSQLVAFHWDRLGLAAGGASPKLPGYLADVTLAPTPLRAGATTVYGLLNQTEGLVLRDKTFRLLAWDL